MIRGVHTMFYSPEPEVLRAFLRDRLGFSTYSDMGGGWLIFRAGNVGLRCANPTCRQLSGQREMTLHPGSAAGGQSARTLARRAKLDHNGTRGGNERKFFSGR